MKLVAMKELALAMKRLALALTALAFLCGQTQADGAEKPNVLFLIVDDLAT